VNALESVTRPDGRVYRPTKIAAYAVVDEDDLLSGVAVLGTHDMTVAQRMADDYATWQLGSGSVALDPETGWFREGLSHGRRMWMRDPVTGRAGVMFHGTREAS
jgi:hypothetical protein